MLLLLLSSAPPREPASPGTFTLQSLSTPTHYQPSTLFEGQNQKTEIRTFESHGHSIHWIIMPQFPPSANPSSLWRRSYRCTQHVRLTLCTVWCDVSGCCVRVWPLAPAPPLIKLMKCVFTNIPASCPLPDTMRTQIGSSAFYKHTHGRAEYFSIYSPLLCLCLLPGHRCRCRRCRTGTWNITID